MQITTNPVANDPKEADMDEVSRHLEETKPQYSIVRMYTKGSGKENEKK